MDLTIELWAALNDVVTDGPCRDRDLDELVVPLHLIQRYVMSNAAARENPEQFRALGDTLR